MDMSPVGRDVTSWGVDELGRKTPADGSPETAARHHREATERRRSQLARTEHLEELTEMSASWSTPSHVLTELSWHPEPLVRATVAGNSGAPEGVLARLSRDRSAVVRRGAAGNRSTPESALRILGCDAEPDIADRATEELASRSDEHHLAVRQIMDELRDEERRSSRWQALARSAVAHAAA